MLITHKAQLGIKIVEKVTVLSDDDVYDDEVEGEVDIHLAFHIIDAPPDMVEHLEPPAGGMANRAEESDWRRGNSFLCVHEIYV